MRKLFVVLVLLVAILFIGCAVSKDMFHSMPADSVYIDSHNSWINQCPVRSFTSHGRCDSPWRSVTIRVINTKYRDARVTVQCVFMPEQLLFGEQSQVVRKRDDATFMVWGTARMTPDSETIRCNITKVE